MTLLVHPGKQGLTSGIAAANAPYFLQERQCRLCHDRGIMILLQMMHSCGACFMLFSTCLSGKS